MQNYTPYSELKVFHHLDHIKGLLEGDRVSPIYVRIKPTNVCNQNCYYCGYANDSLYDGRKVEQKDMIPWEIMERTLQELSEIGVKAITFSGGGEPLCYPFIGESFALARNLGMDYSIITNGQALQGEIADYLVNAKWVRVSFDAYHSQTYKNVRRVNTYDQVIRNIENFARKKTPECTLGINCVVTEQNAEEIYDICRLVKSLGVDNIKLSPIMVKKGGVDYHKAIRDQVLEQIVHAKQHLEDNRFKIVDKYTNDLSMEYDYRKKYDRCVIQELFTVIAADAKVYRCHQRAYTKAGEIGDLTQNTFREIWYSKDTISNIRNFNPCKECEFRCAFDERNMLLNDFLNIDRNHINFI